MILYFKVIIFISYLSICQLAKFTKLPVQEGPALPDPPGWRPEKISSSSAANSKSSFLKTIFLKVFDIFKFGFRKTPNKLKHNCILGIYK